MNTALEYSTRVVQEGGRRCKKSTLNDLVHLTPLRIPLMNPPFLRYHSFRCGFWVGGLFTLAYVSQIFCQHQTPGLIHISQLGDFLQSSYEDFLSLLLLSNLLIFPSVQSTSTSIREEYIFPAKNEDIIFGRRFNSWAKLWMWRARW
jgi:hypothetical protein